MKEISTLIKPTNQCNMRCKYCFHEKYGYSSKLLEIEKLKKYIELLCSEYDYINVVWHGGEPLIAPLSFYEEIYDFCDKQSSDFLFTVQTNGTLLNQEKIDFFKERDTNIGLSFDGLNNDYTRSHTKEIVNNINLLQENGFRPGAILVVNNKNVKGLIDEYSLFNSMNVGLKLNPMFIDGAAAKNLDLCLNPDEYINEFIKFFKYWTKDKNGKINVATCIELVNLILSEHTGVCTFNSCLSKWLCLDSDANIYPCDRLCTSNYLLGNVDDLNSITEVFDSANFIKLLKTSVDRRKQCMDECQYYKNCYSGCNANAILNQNDKYKNGVSCHIQKGILSGIKDYVLETANNEKDLNPQYIKALKRLKAN